LRHDLQSRADAAGQIRTRTGLRDGHRRRDVRPPGGAAVRTVHRSRGAPGRDACRAAAGDLGGEDVVMVITLVGYRGSGKTTVAPALADRLGWEWADADAILEQAAGASIREIFAAEGEAGFRRRERETLIGLFARDRLVLAAGGGAVLDSDTRRDLKA